MKANQWEILKVLDLSNRQYYIELGLDYETSYYLRNL